MILLKIKVVIWCKLEYFVCHMTLIILCYVFYSECLRYCYCLSISISNIFYSEWLRYYYWFVRFKSFLRSNNYCEHTTNYYLRSNFSYIAIFFCRWIDRHKAFYILQEASTACFISSIASSKHLARKAGSGMISFATKICMSALPA